MARKAGEEAAALLAAREYALSGASLLSMAGGGWEVREQDASPDSLQASPGLQRADRAEISPLKGSLFEVQTSPISKISSSAFPSLVVKSSHESDSRPARSHELGERLIHGRSHEEMLRYLDKNIERGSSAASGSCTPLYSVSDIDVTDQKISETMEAAEKRWVEFLCTPRPRVTFESFHAVHESQNCAHKKNFDFVERPKEPKSDCLVCIKKLESKYIKGSQISVDIIEIGKQAEPIIAKSDKSVSGIAILLESLEGNAIYKVMEKKCVICLVDEVESIKINGFE
ncbi:hypothetical protein GUITHDRAFT_99527 [Guillardia theta CCMP2712]|uniref:Uncharacterized protein n=1 Tax=Guillardia theta (strain CCMP2712) TaxID=905079 RepID=L1K350_GUITC|nr:hypothetical protein GUITHDRAFT_99527 [Guillardia theta CCMP2712]EKX54875.1 hypothetical protein GUITHDRAFT_99527 [Guillardia theta CCMP2712]|eukprot:XP_005841855.1 hypothetical protein GUITHDRAFT_99527 [Guillardia theta CCMP2712]